MSVQPNNPQQRNLPVQADAAQSVQPQPQPRQYPVKVNVAEPWTGNPIVRQTGTGTLTFVGWADSGKHYEVWQDASGRQYVRNIGGNWYRGEDVAKAQAESQKTLQQLNVLETQYNPQLSSEVHRYFREGDKWFALEYNPQSNSYTKVEVPAEKLQQDIFGRLLGSPINISGYNIPNIEKYAVQEPHVFKWYGPEYAERYVKLRETFPELQNEKWITEADVQHAVSARLEKYGWRPDTREKYEQLRELSFGVLHNPDAWKDVQADLDRQISNFNRLQVAHERLGLLEGIPGPRQMQSNEMEKQLKQFYKSAAESTPTWGAGLQGFFQNLPRFLSFGLINPAPSGYESLLFRYEGIANKAPAPGMMLPSHRIREGLEAGVYTSQEQAEIRAIEQNLDPTKTRLYTLGYGAAFWLSGKIFDITLTKVLPEAVRFTKWEFSEEGLTGKALRNIGIEPKTPDFLSNISETLKTKALNIGEKIGLVEKVDYVPTRAEVDVAMLKEGGEERAIFKTSLEDFKPAREVLGVERVPLEYRVSGSDVSLLKLRPDYEQAMFKEIKYIGEEPVFGGPATYRGFDTGLNAFLKITRGETRLPPDYLLDFEKWVTEGKAPFANEPFYYRVPYEKYVFSSPAEKAEFMRLRGAFAYGSPSEGRSIIAVGKPLENFEPGFIARAGRYGGEIDYSELIERLGGYKPQVPETFSPGDIVSKARSGVYEFNYFWKITFPEKVMDVFEDIGGKLKGLIGLGKEAKEVPEWQPVKIESETPTQFAPPQTTGFKPVAGKAGLVELVVEESEPAGQVKPIVEPEMKIPVITKTELAPQVRTAVEFTRIVEPRLPSLYGLTHSFSAGELKIALLPESTLRPSQELKPPSLDTFIQPRIKTDIFTGQAPRLGEITMPKLDVRLEPWLDTRIEPKMEPRIGEITVPKIEPKIEVPPINIPDYKPPPGENQPRLPGLPAPVSSGTRDIPIYNPARLYGRKEWVVEWFGPMALSPSRKSKRSRRGGRKK